MQSNTLRKYLAYFTHSRIILILLTVLVLTLILLLPIKFSYVYNENGRLASGLINIQKGDFSVFCVNPPLSNIVGAFPSFCVGTYCPTTADLGVSHFGRMEYKAGDVWIKKNPDHFRWIKYGRYCMIVFVLLGIIISYIWTKEMYDNIAALMAPLLWMLSPYIIGHGCFVCPDVPSASLAITAVFFFHRWLKTPEMFEAMLAGLVLGLAELTKFTLLIFYPLFLVLWILYRKPTFEQTKQICVLFVTSLLIINMGYLFEDTGKPLGNFKFQTTLFTGYENSKDIPAGGGNRFEKTFFAYLPVPLPANFVQGIDTQRLDFERGLPSYLRGEWSDHGWWYYYLYALLIKTPLGVLGLFVLAIFCSFYRGFNASWRDEMVILLPGIVLLLFVSSQTGFSVHSRYVIPALPFFFVWMSKVGKCFTLRKLFLSMIVSVLMTWSIFSSLWVYPYSISYFNELTAILATPNEPRSPQEPEGTSFIVSILNAGSRNGGRHLLDSNIDWGQDIFYLEKWCQRHPEVTEIYTALSGSYPLEQTKIPKQSIPPSNDPQPGWYALSVNYLYDREKQYRYFLNIKPVAKAGYSIYIYHLTLDDTNQVRRKLDLPLLNPLESKTE